jgi:hypothetical protein
MKHITQLVCNGNAITSHLFGQDRMTVAGPILQEEKQVRVATAIFPSASMMNHSCDPNILTRFANESISQGSMAVADLVGRTGGNSAGPEHTTNVKRCPHGPFWGPLSSI